MTKISKGSPEEDPLSVKDRINAWIKGPEQGTDAQYSRRLLDGRIEKYLDRNFNSYIREFGLVRSIDLKAYDERVDLLVPRVDRLLVFSKDLDANVNALEARVRTIKKKVGSITASSTMKNGS